jgi:hypothetical protein
MGHMVAAKVADFCMATAVSSPKTWVSVEQARHNYHLAFHFDEGEVFCSINCFDNSRNTLKCMRKCQQACMMIGLQGDNRLIGRMKFCNARSC